MERLALTSLLFIPAATPPHKALEGVADAADRLEMIRLAISDHAEFSVSDVEINRAGPSYTIDTIAYFQSGAAKGVTYYLIVGLDAFLEIDTWKSYKKLMRNIPLVVLARPEIRPKEEEAIRGSLLQFLQEKISPDYIFSVEIRVFPLCRFSAAHCGKRGITGAFRYLCSRADSLGR